MQRAPSAKIILPHRYRISFSEHPQLVIVYCIVHQIKSTLNCIHFTSFQCIYIHHVHYTSKNCFSNSRNFFFFFFVFDSFILNFSNFLHNFAAFLINPTAVVIAMMMRNPEKFQDSFSSFQLVMAQPYCVYSHVSHTHIRIKISFLNDTTR